MSAETLLLDPSGRVEYAVRVLDDGETTWLLIDAGTGAGLLACLTKMRFMLRVEVARPLGGVRDRSARSASWPSTPAGGGDAAPNGVPLVWSDPWRRSWPAGTSTPRCPTTRRATGTTPRRSSTALASTNSARCPAAGTLALEALRIAAWRPRAATEVDGTTIPHELDWLRTAVHLSKGCYRGQETVAKVHNLGHPPRRLVLLHLDGSEGVLPAAGDEVLLGGAVVGRVTAAALHHELGRSRSPWSSARPIRPRR